MSNTNNIPGLLLPTQKAMLAGNPRDSAIAEANASNEKLLSLQSIGGRGRRRGSRRATRRASKRGSRRLRKRYGGASTINVPQFPMPYKEQGGPGQTPNSIIQQNASVGTQSAANSVYDKYATQMGGYYDIKMNTNTNQYQWGCYSGGKKYKKKRTKRHSRTRRRIRSSKRKII
jgi:hypothetical protein